MITPLSIVNNFNAKNAIAAGCDLTEEILEYIPPPAPFNARVLNLQENLVLFDFDVGQFGLDGKFGKDTEAAVVRYQQRRGLPPDGIVNFDTQMKICDDILRSEFLVCRDGTLPVGTGVCVDGSKPAQNRSTSEFLAEPTSPDVPPSELLSEAPSSGETPS